MLQRQVSEGGEGGGKGGGEKVREQKEKNDRIKLGLNYYLLEYYLLRADRIHKLINSHNRLLLNLRL